MLKNRHFYIIEFLHWYIWNDRLYVGSCLPSLEEDVLFDIHNFLQKWQTEVELESSNNLMGGTTAFQQAVSTFLHVRHRDAKALKMGGRKDFFALGEWQDQRSFITLSEIDHHFICFLEKLTSCLVPLYCFIWSISQYICNNVGFLYLSKTDFQLLRWLTYVYIHSLKPSKSMFRSLAFGIGFIFSYTIIKSTMFNVIE